MDTDADPAASDAADPADAAHRRRRPKFERTQSALPPAALGGAAAGAVVGALVWGLIAWKTGYEVGYVALGIGYAVGYGAARFGGRGTVCGVVCAVLALGGILGGKAVGTQWAYRAGMDEMLTQENYHEARTDAAGLAKVTTPEELRAYLVDHGFSEAKSGAEVPAEEVAAFETFQRPRLTRLAERSLSFEEWREDIKASGAMSVVDGVKSTLGPLDLLFAALGIVTAFRVGEKGRARETHADTAADAPPPPPL
jgi:hypothetical protein